MGRRTSKRPQRTPAEKHRVGRRIRAREVRVIDETGQQLGILDTREAMDRADEAGLQLVEVNPKANPPVCKIMDYGKFKYEAAKRERDAKKNQKLLEVKEVKFRPKTHEHDFDFKVRHVRRFLEAGDKVRLLVQFRGREVVHPETGRNILERVCKDVADVATVAQIASMEGNRMNMILAPKNKPEGGGGSGSKRSSKSSKGEDGKSGKSKSGSAKSPGGGKPDKSEKQSEVAESTAAADS